MRITNIVNKPTQNQACVNNLLSGKPEIKSKTGRYLKAVIEMRCSINPLLLHPRAA